MTIKVTVAPLDFESSFRPYSTTFAQSEISIGRDPENDLVLDTPEISGRHAKLRIAGRNGSSRLYLVDLGSTNGTQVESRTLQREIEVEISPRQRIMVGGIYLIKPEFVSGRDEKANSVKIQKEEVEEFEIVDNVSAGEVDEDDTAEISEEECLEALGEGQEESTPRNVIILPYAGTTASDVEEREEIARPSMASVISSSRCAPLTISVSAHNKEQIRIDFEATLLVEVSGVVCHNGEPLAGVLVDGGELGQQATNSAGVFTFDGVPEGKEYSFSISKAGYIFSRA